MGKQPEKKVINAPDQFFVFGIDSAGKPRGARFTEFNDRALKFALSIGMVGVHPASPAFAELAMKLPAGRLYASGKAFIPNVRRDAVKDLNAIVSSAGDTSQQHRPSPPAAAEPQAGAVASGLPRDWSGIEVGQAVLVEEGPEDGFWACLVIKREADILTLRLRDYPTSATLHRLLCSTLDLRHRR
jgi:hypothetical protein